MTDSITVLQVRALYKGLMPPLMTSGVLNAIVFAIYQRSMSELHARGKPKAYSIAVSSALASLVQTPLGSVMELMKLQLQVQGIRQTYHARHTGPLYIALLIYRQKGIRGFSKGMAVTYVRDVFGFVPYFLAYEALCHSFASDETRMDQLSALPLIMSGGIAGMITWACCYPLDVVKSRLQTDGVGGAPTQYRGVVDCVRKSYSVGGWRVFWNGLGVTLLRGFPVNAATFYAVTLVVRLFNNTDGARSTLL